MPSASKGPQDVAFLPGMRQDLDTRTAPPGTLRDARNVRFGKRGGVYPRPGSGSIGTTSDTIAHVIAGSDVGWIDRIGDAGYVGAAGKAFARDDTNDRWRFQGLYSTTKPLRRRRGLIGEHGSGFASRYAVAALATGEVLVAASDLTDVHYQVEKDGVVSLYGTVTGTEAAAVVIGGGTGFMLVYQNGTALRAIEITPGATTTATASVVVGTLGASSQHWDVTPSTGGAEWYLAHQTSTTNIRLDRFLITTSQANSSITVAAGLCPVSLYHNATGLWVGLYENVATVRYAVRNTSTLASVLAVTTIEASADRGRPLFGAVPGSATIAFFVYQRTGAAAIPPYSTRYGTATSTGTVSTVRDAWSTFPISKPDSEQRFWVTTSDYSTSGVSIEATHRCLLLRAREVDATTPMAVELSLPPFTLFTEIPLGIANWDYAHHIASGSNSNIFALPRAYRSGGGAGGLGLLIGLEVVEYETATAAPGRSTVQLAQTLAVSGQPVELPGRGVSRLMNGSTASEAGSSGALEIGFAQKPRILSVVVSNGSGSLTVSSSYSYLAVFEHIDPLGRRHRSAPSAPFPVTTGASDDTAALTLSTMGVGQQIYTGALGGTTIVFTTVHIYRTAAGGDSYRRVTPPHGAPIGWDVTDGTVTFTDTIADSSLTSEFIYTDGGVKDNALAPSCRVVFETDGRLGAALGWDRNVTTKSKLIVPGEPPQFTEDDAFRSFYPEDLEAVAFMDGAEVGWSKSAIYVVSGDGPNDQGIGAFAEPRLIVRGIGATSEIVLVTELGALFFNVRGWWLLPRGFGSPVHVGAAVQDITAPGEYDEPVAATVHQDGSSRAAHLMMRKGEVTRTLVMDLDVRTPDGLPAWSYDTLDDLEEGETLGPWPGGMLVAASGSLLFFDEEQSEETDAGSTMPITTSIETADIRLFGLAGQGRVASATLLASNSDGNPTLTTTCTPDDITAEASTATRVLSATTGAIYQQAICKTQYATSVRVAVTVERTDEFGPALHGLAFEANQEPGARRVSGSER